MNGYSASKAYFNWAVGHPQEASTSMGLLYLYLVEICNRLGWKKTFAITSGECKAAISVASYNTYRNALDRLVKYGFIDIVKESINQYTPTIVSLRDIEYLLDPETADGTPENTSPEIALSKFNRANEDRGGNALLKNDRANQEDEIGLSKNDRADDSKEPDPEVALSSGLSKFDNPTETIINNKTKTKTIHSNNTIIIDSEVFDEFEDFKRWILDNAPNVAKMKEPFTREQFERLFADYPAEVIYEKLGAMHNYKPLLSKCNSANLTIRNWIRRDNERKQGSSGSFGAAQGTISGAMKGPNGGPARPFVGGQNAPPGGKVGGAMAAIYGALRPDQKRTQ